MLWIPANSGSQDQAMHELQRSAGCELTLLARVRPGVAEKHKRSSKTGKQLQAALHPDSLRLDLRTYRAPRYCLVALSRDWWS